MLYPLTFHPIFKERIWGGQNLKRLYGKALPQDNKSIGESWEVTDRDEGVSVIANGTFAGKTLRWLMENKRSELLGESTASSGRFPLLVKILDAEQTLSLQVHPPATVANALGGEPKTEMWYIVEAKPGAELFVGLKRGVSRGEFERKIFDGSVADCFHRIQVRSGDAMFLPSGRVHAIGGGLVIFEIQQNSDTTYRVFDWNRKDASGKPRDLHVRQSLASIDFEDFEPGLVSSGFSNETLRSRRLMNHPVFAVDECELALGSRYRFKNQQALVIGVISGSLFVGSGNDVVNLESGGFCVIPASVSEIVLNASRPCRFLRAAAA